MANTNDRLLALFLAIVTVGGVGCAEGSDHDGGASDGGGGDAATGGSGGDAAAGGGDTGTTPFCETIESAAESCTDPLPWETATSCPDAEACWRGLTRDDAEAELDECFLAAVCTDPEHCYEYLGGQVEGAESLWNVRFTCVDRETACGGFPYVGALCERMRAASANLLDDAVSSAILACLERDCPDVEACAAAALDEPQVACGWAIW